MRTFGLLAGLCVALMSVEAMAQSLKLKDLVKRGYIVNKFGQSALVIAQKGSEAYVCDFDLRSSTGAQALALSLKNGACFPVHD